MSPLNTPPHSIPSDTDEPAEEQDYVLDYEVVSDHDDEQPGNFSEDDEEMDASGPDDAVRVLEHHAEPVFCVDIHPTGAWIVSGAQDHTAVIWDSITGTSVFDCSGHEDSVIAVSFSPDGVFLATGDMAGGIVVWKHDAEATSWTQHTTLSTGDLLWLKWWRSDVNKPQVLLMGSEDGIVVAALITGTAQKRPPKYLVGPGGAVITAEVVPSTYFTDRPLLAAIYRGGEFRVWDLKTEQPVVSATLPTPPVGTGTEGDMEADSGAGGYICMAAPKPTNKSTAAHEIVAVGTFEEIVLVPCNPPAGESGSCKKLADHMLNSIKLESAGTVEAIDFSWTHPFLAFGTVNGEIGIFDVSIEGMRQRWTYIDPAYSESFGVGITALKWSKTAPIFFTSNLAGSVVAWAGLPSEPMPGKPTSGAASPLAVWRGHIDAVLDFALSSAPVEEDKPAILVSASDDTTLRIFSLSKLETGSQ